MVSIFFQYGIHFFLEKVTSCRILSDVFNPHRQFCLQVYSYFIGSMESGFGGTPRMKTDMIHAIIFYGQEDTFPVFDSC